MRTSQRTSSGIVVPSTEDVHDINHPQYRAAAVARLTRFGLGGTSQQRTAGKEWYDLGHQAVVASKGDVPLRTAAGIASALSPGSDWSKKNVPSIGETQLLHPEDLAHGSVSSREAQDPRSSGAPGQGREGRQRPRPSPPT